MQNYYEVIGVSEDASQVVIRTTYLRLLQIYHPDHNGDPKASQKTAELIEAYRTLGDSQKRAEYDRTRNPVSSAKAQQNERVQSEEKRPFPDIVCQQCGLQDATLRSSLIYWVVSVILVTRRGARSGTWCEKCTAKQTAIWSTITGCAGWWGFPWGPIYTVPALYHNILGGKRDRLHNAQLLRLVGYQLFQKGQLREALTAFDSSLSMEMDQATATFANSLRGMPHTHRSRGFPFLKVAAASPSVAVILILVVVITGLFNEPTGYVSRFQPNSGTTSPASKPLKSDTPRERANNLVDQLAGAVAANAKPAGSHQEGTNTIRDYELDRSKYTEAPFENVSSHLEPILADRVANADGFVSSAYFNARLMELSVAVLNKYEEGEDISPSVNQIKELQENEEVARWLLNSKYALSYRALEIQLVTMVRSQQIGTSHSLRKQELEDFGKKIKEASERIKEARNTRDSAQEHTWVVEHNHFVDLYNSLLKRERLGNAIYEKVDLAFNRCLDQPSL